MPGSGAVRLGPVARKLLSPDVWTDGYPGPEAYVKELDVLLKFADDKACLSKFVPNLEARNKQRDEALNELRLAYLLDSLNFPVVQWDPPGLNGKIGEFLLDSPEKIQSKAPAGRANYLRHRSKWVGRSNRSLSALKAERLVTGRLFTDAFRLLKLS